MLSLSGGTRPGIVLLAKIESSKDQRCVGAKERNIE